MRSATETRRYRRVSVELWSDAKFRTLSDDGKLAFVHVLTHPHLTAIGAMRAHVNGLSAELGWTPERYGAAMNESVKLGMVEVDPDACLLVLPNFLPHNLPPNPNVVRSWGKALPLLPQCDLLTRHLGRVREMVNGLGDSFGDALDGVFVQDRKPFGEPLPKPFRGPFGKPSRNGMPKQEQEQEQEQEERVSLDTLAGETPAPASSPDFGAFVEAWNMLADATSLSRMRATERRARAFRTRMKDAVFRDGWREALTHSKQSEFLMGRKRGSTWRMNSDWFLKPDSVQRILEGHYDDGKQPVESEYEHRNPNSVFG